MHKILNSNDAKYRLIRTIIQGVIGVLIANVDLLIDGFHFEPQMKAFIVALTMAILSPIMAELGNAPAQIQTTFNGDGLNQMLEEDFEDEKEIDSAEE